MPTFARSSQPLQSVEADTVAVFAARDDEVIVLGADAAGAGQTLRIDLLAELTGVRFNGDLGSLARIPTRGQARAAILLVVGVGEVGELTLERFRRAAGSASRNAAKDSTLALTVPLDLLGEQIAAADAVQAAVEGAGLGAYAFTSYRSKAPDAPALQSVLVLSGQMEDAAVDRGLAAGEAVVRGTWLTRDLVNTPPGAKRPPALAERIAGIAREAGLQVTVFDEQALASGGFGGILGAGRGSSERPRLVQLVYDPGNASDHVVLVGKGITFDTGGISLKSSAAMSTMKSDMSGAAAVVGAMSVLRELGVANKVTGLLALAENMPSGDAIRVSDVLVHRGGTTVEVMNTDAEGRLVLADALAYGAELEPDAMIDVATLTGAQVVALGNKIAGLMGSDDALVAQVEAAAAEAGEQVWRLPLPPEYAEQLKSEVADFKNIGRPGQAGTLVAGLFLKEFTAGVPWAHLDIAGPAFTEDGDNFYIAKGGTGMGVRTLLRFLQQRGQGVGE